MNGTTMDGGTFVRGDEGLRQLVASLAEQNAQLEHALESRILVEQAKGMLAERWDVTPAHAFVLLRSAARSHRMRVHDLARSVLASRTTPPELHEVTPR
jgi:AmiR/NasT family two-component response regulator